MVILTGVGLGQVTLEFGAREAQFAAVLTLELPHHLHSLVGVVFIRVLCQKWKKKNNIHHPDMNGCISLRYCKVVATM